MIRVVAGPGAGKTTCLKRRIRRLVEGDGADPTKMFVGTFTRAIAGELKRELDDDIKVQTLHSLALQLLRAHPAACQGMKLRFLLKYEEDVMLYDIAQAVSEADQTARRKALRRLQSARAERREYDDAAFAGAVRTWLQRHGGMLVGEVVYLAVTGLESGDIPGGAFDHVVVDEYQDLTTAEQELVELVWSRAGSLVVMGDNDQSIYKFRYNHPEGVEEFRDRWQAEGVIDLTFPDNRRCGEAILEVANLMMREAGSNKAPMNPASGRAGCVALVHWATAAEEIRGLTSYIKSKPAESFLVLVPRRFIGYRLKEALGDGAQTAFHEEILEHSLTQERFALAALLANPDDLVAVRAWLGFRGGEPAPAPARNAVAYASLDRGLKGRELLEALAHGSVRPSGTGQENVRRRAAAALPWLEETGASLADLVARIFDPELAKDEPDVEKRRWVGDDLRSLNLAATELARGMDEPTLARVVAGLSYRIATRAPLMAEDEAPRVRIMTLHSAKGLEGDNIVIAGAADQIMPGRTESEEDLDEQRRLLYVAITRARDDLVISWPRAIDYSDAPANGIRIDEVFTEREDRYVRLSRTSLLPQALPGGMAGQDWLAGHL